MLEKRTQFRGALPIGTALSFLRGPLFRRSGWLGWRQWLVLLGMGAAVIAVEVHSHTVMWREHQSGQTLLTDRELQLELVLYGLIFPILTGVFLGYMGRVAKERDRISKELQLRRALVTQMNETQTWSELADLVVAAPGSVVSADRAWLMAQRSDAEVFDQISHWEHPEKELSSFYPPVSAAACEHCMEGALVEGTRILACRCPDSDSGSTGCNRYCLRLSGDGGGTSVLLFDMPVAHPLDMSQMKILDELGDEMSLAIDNANLHHAKQHEVDVATNERLRIARDLHDTLGQNVSYLRLKLEYLNTIEPDTFSIALQNELPKMVEVAEEAYEQVRDTLEELRAPNDQALEETIRLYAAQAAERAGFTLAVRSAGQSRKLSARQSRQMIYIVRETLNNVEKHANAQNVEIKLFWGGDECRLVVSDDGKGFEPGALDRENHYGMDIIAERARAINSNLVIKSAPGEGTELMLSVPLAKRVIPVPRSP